MDYKGTIIEESLENNDALKSMKILSTKVEPITEEHQTPWLKQWTLHKVEILETEANNVAEQLSKTLRGGAEHDSWYADYKNDKWHYIVFRKKIFKIDRSSAEQYAEAKEYGISLGIPEYQVDFSPDIK